MLRLTRRLAQKGTNTFGTGGMPFSDIGNIYARPVNPDDYIPKSNAQSGTRVVDYEGRNGSFHMNPALVNAIETCPYFGLCDMSTWHGMDMQYLDPGLLTKEEHHLLLLHSRAYYEKWKTIHAHPREFFPQMRIKKGPSALLEKVCVASGCTPGVHYKALVDMLVDDASLIAMKPRLWTTAHLDPTLRLHITGAVLQKAGLTPMMQSTFYDCLDSLRCYRLVTANGTERVIQFRETPTLWDLYNLLDLPKYNGQLRILDFVDRGRVVSLRSEDDFFDFKYFSFADGDFFGGPPHEGQCCGKYEIQVQPDTYTKAKTGVWF